MESWNPHYVLNLTNFNPHYTETVCYKDHIVYNQDCPRFVVRLQILYYSTVVVYGSINWYFHWAVVLDLWYSLYTRLCLRTARQSCLPEFVNNVAMQVLCFGIHTIMHKYYFGCYHSHTRCVCSKLG